MSKFAAVSWCFLVSLTGYCSLVIRGCFMDFVYRNLGSLASIVKERVQRRTGDHGGGEG